MASHLHTCQSRTCSKHFVMSNSAVALPIPGLKFTQYNFHYACNLVKVGPGLQCRLTSPRRLYTKLHLSRELELKTRESCLLGISARNEGQNSPSADKNQKFGMHPITFAPHRPQQKENPTNSGGAIEKCGANGTGNEKPKRQSQKAEGRTHAFQAVARCMRGTTQIYPRNRHAHTYDVVLTTAPPR